jgi:cardiolipin synthase
MPKTILFLALLVFCVPAFSDTSYFDRPFLLPGTAHLYYKNHLAEKMLPVGKDSFDCAAEVLVDRDQVYPAALEMMRSAKKQILFNMYLFGGKIGEDVLDILIDKRKEGVQIHLILPKPKKFGSSEELEQPEHGQRHIFETLYQLEPKFVDPEIKPPYYEKISKAIELDLPVVHADTRLIPSIGLVRVDHNKIIVVDGTYAMFGGMNFAETTAKNHDTMVRLTGPFVGEIEKVFANNWLLGHARQPIELQYNEEKARKAMQEAVELYGWLPAKVKMTATAPYLKNTREKLIELYDSAKEYIYIEQLLFNDTDVLKAVARAAKRGVKVRALVDTAEFLYSMDWKGGPNNKAIFLFQTLKQKFPEIDAEILHFRADPGQELHFKMTVVDGKTVCLGSTNFTSGALQSNYEAFAFFEGSELARKYTDIFENDWQNRGIPSPQIDGLLWLISIFSDILF